MKRFVQIGLLVVLGAAVAPKSRAREVTFVFTGTVTSIETADCRSLPDVVTPGDTITGSYTFESDTPGDPYPNIACLIAYQGAVKADSLTVGGISCAGDSGWIQVWNDCTSSEAGVSDTYRVWGNLGSSNQNDDCNPSFFDMNLDDPTGLMLTGSALPTTPPAFPLPADRNFELRVNHDDVVHGIITSLTLWSPDSTPPTVTSVVANPSVLWPPNGKLTPVAVVADITDDMSGVASATLIIDDEYNECDGTAPMTLNAATGLWTATIQLRADRNGNDQSDGGRTYLLTVRAADTVGNASAPSTVGATVLVPHSQGKAKK